MATKFGWRNCRQVFGMLVESKVVQGSFGVHCDQKSCSCQPGSSRHHIALECLTIFKSGDPYLESCRWEGLRGHISWSTQLEVNLSRNYLWLSNFVNLEQASSNGGTCATCCTLESYKNKENKRKF